MGKTWSDAAVNYLADSTMCPRCDFAPVQAERCSNCGADLAGSVAAELREASERAAEALALRQSIADRLPTLQVAIAPPAAAPAPPVPVVAPAPAEPGATPFAAPPRASSEVSVQSVLAVAGAALFAVAAIVFTFLNPDLTDFTTRTTIIAATTVVFLGGAWLLARKGLLFSAESIGALGAVFIVLDIWALSESGPDGISGWAYAGAGTLLASIALIWVAALLRLRTWLWSGLVGLALTPAFFGYALGTPWSHVVGHLAVGFAAIGAHEVARRLAPRFAGELRAEHVTAFVIRLIVVALVSAQVITLDVPTGSTRVLGSAAILAGLAVLAGLGTRFRAPRLWAFLAGAYAVAAVGLVPLAATALDPVWFIALVPAAAALALVGLAAVPLGSSVPRATMLRGALTIALLVVAPALAEATRQLTTPLIQLAMGGVRPDFAIGPQATVGGDRGLAAILALAAVAIGAFAMSRLDARTIPAPTVGAEYRARGAIGSVVSLWIGAFALVAFVPWSDLLRVTQAGIGLGIAVALSTLLVLVPRVAGALAAQRAPLVTAAHALPVLVAVITWVDTDLRVAGGAAVVASIAAVARTVPKSVRPVHLAFAFAYALGIFAAALTLLGLETIAILCLTTTLASVFALLVTLTRWFTDRSWYAVLIVTSIPFLIGIGSVLAVRSGWTALSTAVTFALALTLVVTRRPGLTLFLRAAASALLVPSLAVVVICLGAQLLDVSGSPVTLPIIAVIVACTLPSTGLIGAALLRHGLSERHAAAARLWIEISALVTTVFAVILALVRAAAGLPTTFLVLLIVGIGAVATAAFGRRRYGWAVAWAAWTGALWCVWAIAGIDIVEPYLLPPALIAALVAAFLVWRGLPGIGLPALGLYWTGLATAAVPVLAILAITGSGPHALTPWRAWGLLGSSLLLVVIGGLIPRLARRGRFARIGALRTPTLVIAIVTAAAGAVQAVRFGRGLDPLGYANDELVMLPVLGLSGLALLLAAASARLLLVGQAPDATGTESPAPSRFARSRWLYAPALVYAVAGPIAAIRPGWFPIFTLFTLSMLLLALMLITVARARTRAVTLPPVWFTFALAWGTAVAGWSERELRVEAFSLPLGVALLAAGVIALRPQKQLFAPVNLTSWPNGFEGSWRLLTPGILVTLVPSMLATATDPLTQRAILVIALALAAILVGSLRRLAAPFILGIIALPVENVLVFVVQIGRNIGALPWWITLATAGAVLFVIAATSERRVAGSRGTAARVGDLR